MFPSFFPMTTKYGFPLHEFKHIDAITCLHDQKLRRKTNNYVRKISHKLTILRLPFSKNCAGNWSEKKKKDREVNFGQN